MKRKLPIYILLILGCALLYSVFVLNITYHPQHKTTEPKTLIKYPVMVLHFEQPTPTTEPTQVLITPTPTFEPIIEPTFIAPTYEPTPTEFYYPTPTLTTTPSYHNPFFLNKAEVQSFMYEDTTDQIPYTSDFKCQQFAQTVIKNAWDKYGVVGRLVQVNTVAGGHAVVWFPTVNDGDIYVDATCGDWWAYPDKENNWFHTEQMNATYHHGFDLEMYGFVLYYEYGK